MLEKGRGHKIVRDGFALFADIKTEQRNGNDMVELVRQIIKGMRVAIFAWVKRFLSPSPFLESRFQVIFLAGHFRMVVGVRDMSPAFFGQVNRVAFAVLNRPAFAKVSHAVCLSCDWDYSTK